MAALFLLTLEALTPTVLSTFSWVMVVFAALCWVLYGPLAGPELDRHLGLSSPSGYSA